jgi:aspartate/methionine/tyrosine aminotransferase
MRPPPFELERWFARWEFTAPHLLCTSDVEGWALADLLALADDDSLRRWERLTLGYTESAGLPALREAIAGLYDRIAPDEVLVCAGAEEAVFILLGALLGPGDHAVVAWPAYQSLHEVARSAGAGVTLVPLRAEDGWQPDPDAFARALRPSTRAVVVNFPHNPTGVLPDAAAFRRIAGLAADAGACFVSDEVYRGLEHDGVEPLPAGADLPGRTASIGVLSKAYGLAGLRIGWIASRDHGILGGATRLKDYTTICSSAPSEVLALLAVRARERVLARSRDIVRTNLSSLDAFMERNADRIDWVRPRAGCIGYPRLAGGEPADRLAERALAEAGVLLLPGSVFGDPGARFRIGFGRTDFAVGLDRLEGLLGGAARTDAADGIRPAAP